MIEETVQILRNDRDTDQYYRLEVRAPRVS